jgi:hypothetical protein
MTRNYYIFLFFICFSFLNANNLRNLDSISVANAGNVNHESGSNTLTFEVELGSDPNISGTSVTLTIEVKAAPVSRTLVTCSYESTNKKLTCTYAPNEPYYGIIKLPVAIYEISTATLKLKLTSEVIIKQEVELAFQKAYNIESDSTTSTFLIDCEGGSLPDNAFVQVDVSKDGKEAVADCTLSNSKLNCKVADTVRQLYKISKNIKNGSIKWTNSADIDENILMNLPANSHTNGYGFKAEYKSNKWTFFYHQPSVFALGYYYELKTLLDKKDGTKVTTSSKCNVNKNYDHECTVQLDQQAENDFLYLCKDDTCTSKKGITQKISLSFKNAYELKYSTSTKWTFEIDVVETSIRDGMNVSVSIERNSDHKSETASCTFTEKKLSCKVDNSQQFEDDFYFLLFDKDYASVTWTNPLPSKLKLPIETSLEFISGYELKYNGTFWNFKLDVKLRTKFPENGLILVDILSSSPGVARCEGNKQSAAGAQTTFFCFIELSESATLAINKNKVSGSVTWSKGIAGDSANIEGIIKLTYKKAYDMTFDSDKKWKFFIECQDTSILSSSDKYILGLKYRTSKTSSFQACQAECSLAQTNILSCSITTSLDSTNSKNYLIHMTYPTNINNPRAIIWNSAISDETIILKTDLTFSKGTLSMAGSWNLVLNVNNPKNGALPIDSKVIIGIKKGTENLDITCNVESELLLKCDTRINTAELPALTLNRGLTQATSVTWTNTETNEDFYYFYLNTQLDFISAYDLKFNSNNKWEFKLETSSFPEKTKIIIDILYGNKPSTATCIKESNQQISCIVDEGTQSKDTLIKIYHVKSSESTINWRTIDGIQDIIMTASLNVNSITDVIYEGNKWSFKMNVESCDLPVNSKVKIDILYQQRANTATCTLNDDKTLFLCNPDIATQTKDDKFKIIYAQRSGSVTYTNSESNLSFEGEADNTEIKDNPGGTNTDGGRTDISNNGLIVKINYSLFIFLLILF